MQKGLGHEINYKDSHLILGNTRKPFKLNQVNKKIL